MEQKQSEQTNTQKNMKIIVEHEYVGEKSIAEIFMPIIFDDLKRQIDKPHTLDNDAST